MPYSNGMAFNVARVVLAVAGAAVLLGSYRLYTMQPNEDSANYEVHFKKLGHWKELPHNPNTLVLLQEPKTKALIRCSATQVVSDSNPEPDMDTANVTLRMVSNAKNNQAELWKTEEMKGHDNGKVKFSLFRKSNHGKAIMIAVAVRGNTTLVASLSNYGKGLESLSAVNQQDFYTFLNTIELEVTDKWNKLHERLDRIDGNQSGTAALN